MKTNSNNAEGIVFFDGVGMCVVEWSYRDHGIILAMRNEYNKSRPDGSCTIKVFYDGIEITDKYIEQLYEKPHRIRTTLQNLQAIMHLIDENMDDYEKEIEA